MLASSAFLASASSTFTLQESILSSNKSVSNQSVASTEIVWEALPSSPIPASNKQHIRKAWDKLMTTKHASLLQSRTQCDVDKARLLAASSSHSGDYWLHAPPITSIGLRLSDEAVRLAVARRLGCKASEPHTCTCGNPVDARGLHGLSCRKYSPRQQRHSSMIGIVWRAVKRAQIPATKEPSNLILQNGKRPDGSTLIPWSSGKPMAWDVTVPDTYAESHIGDTATEAGAAVNHAAANRIDKYDELADTHIFYPVAIETVGIWNHWAVELVQEIGRRATLITGDP